MKSHEIILEYKQKPTDMKQPTGLDANLIKELKTNYSVAFAKGTPAIYRGIRGDGSSIYHINPSAMARPSENTTNEMIWLVSTLSGWAAYPKRSRSLICTFSREVSQSYGLTYRVIPRNNAKFGICPARDFWWSFRELEVDSFNMELHQLCYRYGLEYNAHNYDDFIAKLKILNKLMSDNPRIEERYGIGLHDKFKLAIKEQPGLNFAQFLNKILDPVRNNFELTNVNRLYLFEDEVAEVWTDSPCYLINEDSFSHVSDVVLGNLPPPTPIIPFKT